MTTSALRHYHVAPDYGTPIQPSRMYVRPEAPFKKTTAVQSAARIWFNKRKFRQHTRQLMDFVNLPYHLALRFKLD